MRGRNATFLIVKNKSPFAHNWRGKRGKGEGGAKGEEEEKGRAKRGVKATKHRGLSL